MVLNILHLHYLPLSHPSGFTYALLSPILKNKTKQATQPSNPWTFTVHTKFLKLSPKGIDHTSHSLACQPSLLLPYKLLPPLVTKDLHISKDSGCFCPLLCLMASEHLPPLTIIFHNTTFSRFVSLIISTACQILHCLFFFPSQILIWFRFSTTMTPILTLCTSSTGHAYLLSWLAILLIRKILSNLCFQPSFPSFLSQCLQIPCIKN